MRKKSKAVVLSCVLAVSLAGCSAVAMSEDTVKGEAPAPEPLSIHEDVEIPEAAPETVSIPEEDFVPTEEDVLAAREQALSGMTDEQINRLKRVVRNANMWWEHEYLYLDIFGELENPDSLYWNRFDKTGPIQIAWEIPGGLDVDAICEQENLTRNEALAKYGTAFIVNNEHTADDFVAILDELLATVQNEGLRTDLRYIRDEAQLAKDNHSMEHANNEYKALHDMDYFLLRYGPTDVGPYVKDDSTITKYYGMLSIYG